MRLLDPPSPIHGDRYEHGAYYRTRNPALDAEGFVYYATVEDGHVDLELVKFFDGGLGRRRTRALTPVRQDRHLHP